MSRTTNKATNRTSQPRPRHRPPTRHDTRRPAGAPPRIPPHRPTAHQPTTTPQPTHPHPARSQEPTRTRPATSQEPSLTRLPAAPETARTTPRTAVGQPRPTDLFADRLLAVLSGQRPVHWMLRHTAGRAYDDLVRLAERSPLRTRGSLPRVHDIGYYVPRDGALEVFARIAAGDRLRALAFRLELGQDLRWRCTAVETGPHH
ncbi:Rv3235 family protein [Streptomyces sp. NPDC007205]|uniref:Rv3235 family protein n=1 Tax=Streptomyces sp. NPDC007205 TaxID=3154316 RepID=UPI0033E95A14